jgi:ankyrin repeat protein
MPCWDCRQRHNCCLQTIKTVVVPKIFLTSLLLFAFISSGLCQNPTEKEFKLITAAEKGEAAEVLKLLNDSINPDVQDYYGMTPLHYAVQNGHVTTARTLVLNGAQATIPDYDGRTPLHLAVHFNSLDMAEFLVQNKADINRKDIYGLSPLFYSCAYGDYIMTDMFLFYSEGEQVRDPDGRTQFLAAVWGGHLSTASLLLKHFSSIDEKDSKGNNAIHLAVSNRDIEMIDSLHSWGCNINAINKLDYTCLDMAIQENYPDVVEKLIDLGADVNHNIKKGINSLDMALLLNRESEIPLMLEEAGATRNKRLSINQPAIRVSVNSGFQDAFSSLFMELWEPKYSFGLKLGASQRLGRVKVLTEPDNEIRYQYRETRTGIAAGIEKQFMLVRLSRLQKLGFSAGLDAGIFFGQNKGLETKPEKIWALMPSTGLYYQNGPWLFGINVIYQDMHYDLQPLRLSISMSYRFNELK